MAQALPLSKLAGLLIKTLAKPLSKRIKHDFSRFSLTKGMLIFIGQKSHAVSSRMKIWSSGHRVRKIKPLESEKALKDGAEFVGEAFVFSVSGSIVVWEYNRSSESSRKKEEKKRQEAKAERAALQAKLIALDARLKAVEDSIKGQSSTPSMLGLGSRGPKYVEPPAKKIVPIEEEDEEDDETVPQPEEETMKLEETPAKEAANETPKPWWQIW